GNHYKRQKDQAEKREQVRSRAQLTNHPTLIALSLGLRKELMHIYPGINAELFGQRRQLAAAIVLFNALDAMHGKKDNAGRSRPARLDQGSKVVQRLQIHAAQAHARRIESQHQPPKFFPWIV